METWSDQQRRNAARCASMAEESAAVAQKMRETDREALEAFAVTLDAAAYKFRSMQSIVAEQARNYEDFLTAGGHANRQAREGWAAACAFASAMWPTDLEQDPGT